MFSDDYDPSDIPPDQAGYSYPVPANPLELPSMEWDDCGYDDITTDHDMIIWYNYWPWYDDRVEYDDYDPNDVPADQAAPAISGYLSPLPPPEYDVSCQSQSTYCIGFPQYKDNHFYLRKLAELTRCFMETSPELPILTILHYRYF